MSSPMKANRGGVRSWRLVATLAGAGAVAGFAIVLVHGWAEPRIEAHRAAVLEAAVHEVLGGPAGQRELRVVDGAVVEAPSGDAADGGGERVWLGLDAAGAPVGFAVAGDAPGYQDTVRLIFGYDPRTGEVLGMKVLESKETPGLGDKIQKDEGFVAGFAGALPPLVGVKPGAGTGDPHEVDTISGATISSRTVIEIINRRVAALGPALAAYLGAPGAGAGPVAEARP